MTLSPDIKERLLNFFDSYKQKVDFLKYLSRMRKAEDEIILLICCYLDQLGSCLFPKGGSSKRNFELMLLTHSGKSAEFSLISVADFCLDILLMAESVSYIVPKPGRFQLPSEDYKPLIKFIDQIGIPLTEKSIHNLSYSLYENLKSNFKIHPHQTKNKKSYGEENNIVDLIISYPKLRQMRAEIKEEAVRSLIREYKYTSILYRDYRCKAVHEAAGVYVHPNKFWKMKRPYFTEVSNRYFTFSSTLKLEFPASFLIECFETCVECAEKAVIGKGLLPLPIWRTICNLDEFEFMDDENIEEAKPIRLRIE